ncbi:MAG TPA: SPOR domain-containing protein, partial [Geminicoccaceae bacterium]
RPAAAAPVRAATPAAAGGKWRVQLGAFGNAAGAQRAWAGLRSKVAALAPLQPQYVAAGAVTRLRAGPLTDRGAADRVCAAAKAAGAACFPVAP